MVRRQLVIGASTVLAGPAIVALPKPAAAQLTAPAWALGKEVRVTLTDGAPLSGKLVSLSATEVVLRQDGKEVRLPLTRIRRIVTTPREVRKYVIRGTLIGAAGGAVFIRCSGSECPASCAMLPVSAGIGAGVGATVGAIVGRLRPPTGPERVVYEAKTAVDSHRMGDDRLKSAYELAMERFQKKDAEAGVVQQPFTDEQKAAIAEVRSVYQAKIAELEILHRGQMVGMMDPSARELAEEQYRRERGRLERERDSKIEQARAPR